MVKLWSEVTAAAMRGGVSDSSDSVRREKVLCGKRAVKYTSGKTIFAV
jgi:hypothetical protein